MLLIGEIVLHNASFQKQNFYMYYVLLKLWKTGIGFCYLILVITIMSLGLVQAVANCTSSVSFLLPKNNGRIKMWRAFIVSGEKATKRCDEMCQLLLFLSECRKYSVCQVSSCWYRASVCAVSQSCAKDQHQPSSHRSAAP